MQGNSFRLNAGDRRKFPGGAIGTHRKQIIITNADSTSTPVYISIGDPESATAGGRAQAMKILVDTSITIFTNDEVTLFNPHASDAVSAVGVIEVFYTGAGLLTV